MKIAVLTNLDKEIGPNTRGGTELFVYLLVQELAQRSEISQIDVYGVGKDYFNLSKVHYIQVLDLPLVEYLSSHPHLSKLEQSRSDFSSQFHLSVGIKMFKMVLNETYDIVHDNSLSPSFMMLADQLKIPVVSTLHTNFNSPSIIIPYTLGVFQKSTNHFFVPIAKHQEQYVRNNKLKIPIIAQIYNGYDLSQYQANTNTKQNSPVLWIGRISRKHDKGLQETLSATKETGRVLQIISSMDDEKFYQEHIKPYMHDRLEMLPQLNSMDEKNKWYQQGAFLLYPIMWEEPFPNVILETLASGTPVIAFARGSLMETIQDGENGLLVNPSDEDIRGNFQTQQSGVKGLCEAIRKMESLSPDVYAKMRQQCRTSVEERFTAKRMVDDYLKVYNRALTECSSL